MPCYYGRLFPDFSPKDQLQEHVHVLVWFINDGCKVLLLLIWISFHQDIYLHNPDVRWDDIIGLDAAKRLVKEAVVYPIKVCFTFCFQYLGLFSCTLTCVKVNSFFILNVTFRCFRIIIKTSSITFRGSLVHEQYMFRWKS